MSLATAFEAHPDVLAPRTALWREGIGRAVHGLFGAVRPKQPPVSPTFAAFGARYRDDLRGFAHDCIRWGAGEGPTAYQDEALATVMTQRRVAMRGPHGLGKTMLAALVVLGFVLTREALQLDWKLPTTAGAWRQLTKYLWPEIHKWSRRLRWDVIGRPPFDPRTELLAMNLKLAHGEAFAVASNLAELIEGAHADSMLYLLDEAKSIPDPTWDAVEGAFSGAGEDTAAEAFALAISTPGEPVGRFYQIHQRTAGYTDWWARHVTLDEAIAAKRVSREWADKRRTQWGEASAVFQNRVCGNFASQDEDSIIPLSWVEAAQARWRDRMDRREPLPPLTRLGLDVGAGGADPTVLARLHGVHICPLESWQQADTMRAAGVTIGILGKPTHQKVTAAIDVIGVGAGTFYRVRESVGARAVAFNAAEGTDATDRSGELGYLNRRAEAWWGMREQLDPAFGAVLELPPDDILTGELTAPKWWVTSSGKIQVESKDDLRKPDRLGKSTDRADAVIQACWQPKALPDYRGTARTSGV